MASREKVVVGAILYFRASDDVTGAELWRSDGTADGTFMLKDINPTGTAGNPGSSNADYFIHVGGRTYFGADDGVHGYELWTTDGTAAGTVMVKDLNPTGDGHEPT
jgi:ELWxxDGT repeat protein